MPSFKVFLFFLLAASVRLGSQAGADEWRSRSIYQVVTDRFARSDDSTDSPCDPGLGEYCGGTWKGLTDKLDYIQGLGFSAVWISPVTLNLMQKTVNLESYHGYWQQDLHSVNPAFGTASDLRDLADALHEREMYLMVDVVVGNMAYAGDPSEVDYSVLRPFDNEDYFHPYCPTDDGTNVTTIREVGAIPP
jgi:alpha-amylase